MADRMQDLQAMLSGPQAEQLKERALDAAAAAREGLTVGARRVRAYVTEQPARALGIALGMGVVLGWLIKRR
ncbi:MAG TPA: hypothetical protein VG406_13580 [Isosphaeraceae bacterium]|jgi:ElaB/YqjD/DUF883 family membrane-anchored ribosome-binding protein|nr:hypothetical protein [Isosphaeraceae bacterium]